MSTELRDMIIECLENNGCLPKMKAQLRASMFLLLHEDNNLGSLQPLMNKIVKELLEVPEGKLMFCVVYEFLQFCGLECTLNVFKCESYFGQDYNCKSREKIKEELGMKHVSESAPVLLEMIRSFCSKRLNPDEKTNGYHIEECNNKPHTQLNVTFDKSNLQILDKIHCDVSTPQNDTPNSVDKTDSCASCEECYYSVEGENMNKSKRDLSDKTKLTPSKSEKVKSKSSFSSFPDISPIQQSNKSRVAEILPSLYNKEFKDKPNTNELEKMFDIETEYEEDFICSGDDLSLKSYIKTDMSNSQESNISTESQVGSDMNSVQKNIPEIQSDCLDAAPEGQGNSEKSETIEENINKSETEL